MTEWILVVLAYAGPWWSPGDSVAITSLPTFATQAECMQAGAAVHALEDGTKKKIKYVCVKRTNSSKG